MLREMQERAERLVYAGRLALACRAAFAEGNGALALQHLEECQWNLRGWEHHHLWTRFNARQTLRGHTDQVSSVAYSPDGKRLLTGSYDKTAKVWDAVKGQQILSLMGHTAYLSSVAYSPDGQRIFGWDGREEGAGLVPAQWSTRRAGQPTRCPAARFRRRTRRPAACRTARQHHRRLRPTPGRRRQRLALARRGRTPALPHAADRSRGIGEAVVRRRSSTSDACCSIRPGRR